MLHKPLSLIQRFKVTKLTPWSLVLLEMRRWDHG